MSSALHRLADQRLTTNWLARSPRPKVHSHLSFFLFFFSIMLLREKHSGACIFAVERLSTRPLPSAAINNLANGGRNSPVDCNSLSSAKIESQLTLVTYKCKASSKSCTFACRDLKSRQQYFLRHGFAATTNSGNRLFRMFVGTTLPAQ